MRQSHSKSYGEPEKILTSRCKVALSKRARELYPDALRVDGFEAYFERVEDNLPGITPDLYHDEYCGGAGCELQWRNRGGRKCPPKMHAVHSSSALVVNCFAPWKIHLGQLALGGSRGFSHLRFEVQLPTGLGGTPPHLDFLAEGTEASTVATESKLTEFLQRHHCAFAPSYDSVSWSSCVGAYAALMGHLRADPESFTYLNAAQLVKHAFGLGTRFGDRKVLLLYLFWEPENRNSYPAFDRHREEVSQFASHVGGSSVEFAWKSYPELWKEWLQSDKPWLRQHAQRLSERYAVSI